MKKKSIIIALVLLLLIGAFAYQIKNSRPNDIPAPQGQSSEKDYVNLAPPTAEEKKAGDQRKDALVTDSPTQATDVATVVIVDANQYDSEIEVRSFVASHVQDGSCTILFTKGTSTITKKVTARADAKSTPCMNLVVPVSEFASKGTWLVEVIYTSNSGKVSGKTSKDLEVK